ncbi:MAG: DNA-processing protein DprA, partial [Cyanobium sp.]
MGELLEGVFPRAAAALPLERARRRKSWSREQRLWWLLWSRCPGVGWVRLRSLADASGDLARAWCWPERAFADLAGWHAGLLPALRQFRAHWGSDPLVRLALEPRAGLGLLVPGDARWPEGLEEVEEPRPPLALWWQGRGSLWPALALRQAVAVVGTRRPSSHGVAMARSLGLALARAGWPVVSGLAEGIDAAAHAGCLEGGGRPVAVLGTPLERVYPRHHSRLQAEVGRRGLLISEQPPAAVVRAGHFAQRNRLLVALAAAVVVVECPPGSGALHSATHAWDRGLPLWVVPADAGRASALGSNRLLGTGATPLLSPDDLIRSLGAGPMAAPLSAGGRHACRGADTGGEHLLAALGAGADLEQLSLALDEEPSRLVARLLDLEMAGLVRAEPGLRW